jgi:hypothetical protein
MRAVRKFLLSAALIGCVTACYDHPGDISGVQGYVIGRVVAPNNDPISGASVDIVANVGSGELARNVVETTADGIFSTILRAGLVAPQQTNITVAVTPPAGSQFQARTISGMSLFFSAEDPPTDSLRVDVTLESQ